jgi:hypothetical protein
MNKQTIAIDFIYNNLNLSVLAHELGHGVFNLRYTFDDKNFIDARVNVKKEFWFSHDPRLETNSFLKDEYNFLIELAEKKDLIKLESNLWKMDW